MYQKRFVSAEEGFCFPDSASRIEQAVTFVTDMDGQSEILVCPKKIKDLFTEMMNVDHQFVESCRFQFQDYVLQHGASATGTSALGIWSVRGFRRVPRPAAKIMAFMSEEFVRVRKFLLSVVPGESVPPGCRISGADARLYAGQNRQNGVGRPYIRNKPGDE